MQKGIVGVLLILICLLIILFGFFYYSNQSAKTHVSPETLVKSNLSIYANQELGFEFKYGKEFTTEEDSEEEFNERGNGDFRKNFKGYIGYEPGEFLGAVVVLDKDNSFDKNPLTIWVFENPDDLSIDKWYEKFWYYPFVWGDFTARNKKVSPKNIATVSGQVAGFGVVDYQPESPKFIYLSKDKKMYLFKIIGESGEQILSTFKFLQ